MRPKQAAEVASEAVGATGTCSVCGRVGALTHNGRRMRKHQRTIDHDGKVILTTDCRGSRRPPVEFVAAFKAAREK